jgi:signal transduction histidine kinase
MELYYYEMRRIKGAYLLIVLRWIAIAWVSSVTFLATNIANILVKDLELYFTTGALVIVNLVSLFLLSRAKKASSGEIAAYIKKIINFQITSDLIALTLLLHYSGGIENPFIISYIFHMVMASILLSKRESYLQTTLALILLSLMAFLEYSGYIQHHTLHLNIFIEHNLYQDSFYIIRTIFVFVIISYVLVYMTNYIVTRLRKREEELMLANLELQKKDSIKNEYVLRVTHDIKGHLGAIQSCLSVVVNKISGSLDNKNYDFINRAYKRTIKVTHFVNTLLKLTHMRLTGKMKMGDFSLKATLIKAIAAVETKAKDKSIKLNCNIEQSVDKIYGNEFSIEETVTNLLYNAIKYTNNNGIVILSVKDKPDNILVEIEDTGIGIPQDELPKVFDEFYRAGNAKKIDKDGTGLGLSISRQIVLSHGGNIWVESREGAGTKFSFTLPKKHNIQNRQESEKNK